MNLPRAVAFLAFSLAAAGLSAAEPLPAPQGEPLLTVTGAIAVTNVGDAAVFDREMLAALPQGGFTTSTIWTEGPAAYAGPTLRAVLDRVGATGATVRAVALNDYAVTIPVDEIETETPIIAATVDGAAMPVRERGPLWVLYPFDRGPEWRAEVIYSRSIWQLSRLEILD